LRLVLFAEPPPPARTLMGELSSTSFDSSFRHMNAITL
jgi:hypothetical protein